MDIVIFGAGAIGSLFGAYLSSNNNITLIGRSFHVNAINTGSLKIEGKTKFNKKVKSINSLDYVNKSPDLLLLTVKSYDTEIAIKQSLSIINNKTIILSFQNGLDNINKIGKYVNKKQVIAGVTTHGSIFLKPGLIRHTGIGRTILGELDGRITKRIEKIIKIFNKADIETQISQNIIREIWIKAIINSSINPLTSIFQCKNGYLLKNPILMNLVMNICKESTNIANIKGFKLSYNDMLRKTKEVIEKTYDNYSSMLQSIKKGKKTEIESINGILIDIGKKFKIDTLLNNLLFNIICSITYDS